MKHCWQEASPPIPGYAERIAYETGLPLFLANIVALRAKEQWQSWLTPLQQPLCDPFCLPGMISATHRILLAIQRHEPITVFGDYDVDGITGTALLVQALTRLGATVKPFFPDRKREGYGLTHAALLRCLTYPPRPSLVITVDCGITSVDETYMLRNMGIDVVITDHHTLPAILPNANAIVTAQQLPEHHPVHNICGCATAFTLARALNSTQQAQHIIETKFLDLTAIATIADSVPLTGENRIIVAKGLNLLGNKNGNRGLNALLRLQQLTFPLCTEQIAFSIIPCINAASRVGDLKDAYRTIGLEHENSAQKLLEANHRRKEVERALYTALLTQKPAPKPKEHVLILGGENFEAGVIGIVASRLMDHLGIPVALVCKTQDGGGHGSMRSCGNWHAVHALDTVSDLLTHYGGHAKAAGFTLKPNTYQAFIERLPQAFHADKTEEPALYDADLDHEPITLWLCQEILKLEPFGHGNNCPIFRGRFIIRSFRTVGKEGTHLSTRLSPVNTPTQTLKAIWFNSAPLVLAYWKLNRTIRLYFKLKIDTFNAPTPSLIILDAERCEGFNASIRRRKNHLRSFRRNQTNGLKH